MKPAEQQAFAPTSGAFLTKAYVATKGSKSVSLGTKSAASNPMKSKSKKRRY